MDRNCDAFIRSNNTYDILIARESLEISDDRAECIQNIGEKFVAEYFDRDEVPQLSIKTYGYSIIPKCFGLLDTLALETTGILQLQNQPALSLRGQGIFIGFVDTGISYELPCFRNADGSTRIRSIWDQSIPAGEKNTPQGFLYGTEYTQKEINEALEQEHPRELVPVTDEDGHGTMLASIACGSEDLQAGFTGAAPYAELLVVKLKPAKPYLKDFFYIPQEMPAYQENDIMAAIEYLEETARKLGRPLILCLGLGTNNGSHSGGSNLSELLDDIAGRWRRCAVVATGNEANARHHFYGKSDGNSMVAVEVNVEQRMRGFYLELCKPVRRNCLWWRCVRRKELLCLRRMCPEIHIRNRNLYLKERGWKLIMHRWDARGGISLCLSGLKIRRQGSGRCMLIRVPQSRDNFISGCQ